MTFAANAKRCRLCGSDVAQAKRVKDPSGNYYCEPCYEKNAVPAGSVPHVPAPELFEQLPASTPELLPSVLLLSKLKNLVIKGLVLFWRNCKQLPRAFLLFFAEFANGMRTPSPEGTTSKGRQALGQVFGLLFATAFILVAGVVALIYLDKSQRSNDGASISISATPSIATSPSVVVNNPFNNGNFSWDSSLDTLGNLSGRVYCKKGGIGTITWRVLDSAGTIIEDHSDQPVYVNEGESKELHLVSSQSGFSKAAKIEVTVNNMFW